MFALTPTTTLWAHGLFQPIGTWLELRWMASLHGEIGNVLDDNEEEALIDYQGFGRLGLRLSPRTVDRRRNVRSFTGERGLRWSTLSGLEVVSLRATELLGR